MAKEIGLTRGHARESLSYAFLTTRLEPLRWRPRMLPFCANCDIGASHRERNACGTARDIAKKILRRTLRGDRLLFWEIC